ncbi:MAG: hypothetical protein HJJLKODD_02581 [Phycisphaerae bacterium]|nr:hypothetical protein [Phycisphaerae bacterium]
MMKASPPSSPGWLRWLPLVCLSGWGLFLLAISWRRWPDLLIDYGRELYVPWQLSLGDVLYQDVAWIYGPFSPYFHALIFRIFGTGFTQLFITQILIVVLSTLLIYRLQRIWLDPAASTVGGMLFLGLFALNHHQAVGNYNFITPYSHNLTHGLVWSLLSLWCLYKYLHFNKTYHNLIAHFSAGMVYLCKLEVFFAILITILGIWLMHLLLSRRTDRSTFTGLVIALSGLLAPAIAGLFLLATQMSWSQAWHNLSFTSMAISHTGVVSAPFHQSMMGLDQPFRNLLIMLSVGTVELLFLLIFICVDLISRRINHRPVPHGFCLLIGASITLPGLYVIRSPLIWQIMRPLPIFLLILLGLLMYRFHFHRTNTSERSKYAKSVLLTGLTMFSFLLLGKIILRVVLYDYGFVLALPAILLTWIILIAYLPRWFRQHQFIPRATITAICTVMALIIAGHLSVSLRYWHQKSVPLLGTQDNIYINANSNRDPILQHTINYLNENLHAQDRLVVFPEGVMLNYLLRRASSIPYYNFDPSILAIYSEPVMLQALAQHPPEWIVINSRDSSEFKARYFGLDYGQSIYNWVCQHYSLRHQEGTWPPKDNQLSVQIYSYTP